MYLLSKALGGPVVDVMRSDYDLFRELELWAAAEAHAESRRHAEQQRQQRARGKHR